MMTNPPPYDSAPTFNATHASARTPPLAVVTPNSTGVGRAKLPARPRVANVRTPSSAAPHSNRTRTRNGPTTAAERAPAAAYAIHRPWASARDQLAGTRLRAACTATAATAAPAPA